ncbi:MAG: hypothetical protein JOZ96_28715 [Acidobacteria bacterium]|nr:hypothetical protein [Acidobacteriota bacterium]MBV9929030.1 hypothetical protein [Acidobacteriota bacterium]
MNRRNYLLTVALSLAAGLAGHALYGPLAAPTAARAEPRRDAQYEYCAVVKSQAIATPRLFYWIIYFKEEGAAKTETVEASLSGNSQAKAIAKLGEDGWEMVGEGPLDVRPDPRPNAPGTTTTAIFFKRRKD